MPKARRGEATMDLEVIHAIAPAAKTVLVNARPTVEGDGAYQKIAQMMGGRRPPLSRRGVELLHRLGLRQAHHRRRPGSGPGGVGRGGINGTTAFDASGDLAGLECKGRPGWSSPPHADNVGLDAVASMPKMTNVGGTTLSTDDTGGWLAEQAWFDARCRRAPPGSVGAVRPARLAGIR